MISARPDGPSPNRATRIRCHGDRYGVGLQGMADRLATHSTGHLKSARPSTQEPLSNAASRSGRRGRWSDGQDSTAGGRWGSHCPRKRGSSHRGGRESAPSRLSLTAAYEGLVEGAGGIG
jgi:hypothetical protein